MVEFEKSKSKLTEEDIEDIKDNVKKVDKTWSHVMEICTILHRTMPNEASPLIMTNLAPIYGSQLQNADQMEDY